MTFTIWGVPVFMSVVLALPREATALEKLSCYGIGGGIDCGIAELGLYDSIMLQGNMLRLHQQTRLHSSSCFSHAKVECFVPLVHWQSYNGLCGMCRGEQFTYMLALLVHS